VTFELKDYVEVADRIQAWYAAHPDGRIVTEIVEMTAERVIVRAEVYRDSATSASHAGVGHSYLAIPGTTPYTAGSELENAETSAVGRALVMAGIPAKSVASAGELASKRGPTTEPTTGNPARAFAIPAATAVVPDPATGTVPVTGTGACPFCGSDQLSAFDPNDNPLNPGWLRCRSCTRKVKEADVAVGA
jgi:hypothetical protein